MNNQTQLLSPETSTANYHYSNLGIAIEQFILKSVNAALASHSQTHPSLTPQKEPEKEILFSIPELATYLKVTKATIHAYKKRGIFKYYQTGRTVLFKKFEVDQALAVSTKKKGASN